MNKPRVIIRMGAPYFDVRVRGADDAYVTFDHRKMSTAEQRTFHLELLKAFRVSRLAA